MAFTTGYKVNEGTQYEFTVSNETIAEAVQADGGITESDIAAYCYTALVDSRIKSIFIQSTKNVMASGFDGWQAENIPYYFVRDTRNIDSNDDINKDDTVYERNFITWNGIIYPGTPQEKNGTFLVMDMKDIKRWYVDFNAGMFIADTFASEITESGVTSTFPGYNGSGYTYLSSTINEPVIHSDNNDPMQNPNEDLHIVNVLVINDELWIGQLNPSCHGEANTGNFQSTYNQYIDSYVQGYLDSESSAPPPIIYQRGSDSWAGIAEIKEMNYPDLGNRSTIYRSYVETSNGIIMEINGNSGSTFDVRTESGAHCKDLNTLLKWQSWCGLKFTYNNVMYKPIIENGVIVGYSSNMDAESEYDTMTNVTGNNISPTPPSGGGGTRGEWDDMPGAGSSIGALAGARCYICSKTDITNLKNWMSKTEADGGPPDGYDVLSSLISVMAFPIDMTAASSGPAQTISFTGLKTATDNQIANIAAALLSIANSVGATPKTEVKTFTSTATALPSAGNPFTVDLGTCECPKFYSSDFPFADYDASVELYLPFIGTMTLDTQTVMGNSLHAYMSVDPITGAIYSWCECNKNGSRVVVAAGTGAIGVNTPITANQVGMAMAQIKNNAAQSRQTAIQSALTIGMGAITGVDKNMSSVLMKHMASGNKNLVVAGARDYADALSVGAQQASMMALPNAIGANINTGRANRQIAQANHNSISGSAGGSTADWSCSYRPYLKIITPDVHKAGDQYKHTYGIPTVLSGTLSSFKGLTFCANPDVSNISTATDQEKQQIFGLLAGGVYV